MKELDRILVAGASGLIGSAIVRQLKCYQYTDILTPTHKEVDFSDWLSTYHYFKYKEPNVVFLCAAKVGGIKANMNYSADFLMDNIAIEYNIIKCCHLFNCELLFLGSTCIYPKSVQNSVVAMKEDDLLTSDLDTSNEGYAIAKITGLKMVEMYAKQYGDHFKSAMPTNLFGPNDRYSLTDSHVLPAMILKISIAKAWMEENWELLRDIRDTYCNSIELDQLNRYGIFNDHIDFWGTGEITREFLFSDDCAQMCINLMHEDYTIGRNDHVNLGNPNFRIRIKVLAKEIADLIGYSGECRFGTDPTMDGTKTKYVSVDKYNELIGPFKYTSNEEALKVAINNFYKRVGYNDTLHLQED